MRWLTQPARWIRNRGPRLLKIDQQMIDLKILAAKALITQQQAREDVASLSSVEFKVFSQFGEDGIIQYLVHRAGIPPQRRLFVEFGVETYEEANTRFLLLNDNWRGLIIDGSKRNIAKVKQDSIYWRHDLTAIAAFIDAENINRLITSSGITGEIGLLSIDIDGNDYWVWQNITSVEPIIVVAEYNGVFGPSRAVTVPYDPAFVRSKAHYSHLYWGCSLNALVHVARSKGYALVGTNSAGNNAFFLHRSYLNGQPELTSDQAFVNPRFRESRDPAGNLTFLSGAARLREIVGLPLVDVERNEQITIDALLADAT